MSCFEPHHFRRWCIQGNVDHVDFFATLSKGHQLQGHKESVLVEVAFARGIGQVPHFAKDGVRQAGTFQEAGGFEGSHAALVVGVYLRTPRKTRPFECCL